MNKDEMINLLTEHALNERLDNLILQNRGESIEE